MSQFKTFWKFKASVFGNSPSQSVVHPAKNKNKILVERNRISDKTRNNENHQEDFESPKLFDFKNIKFDNHGDEPTYKREYKAKYKNIIQVLTKPDPDNDDGRVI